MRAPICASAGTLVPEDIRWIPARTAGRVEKIVLRAGAQVTPGSVILELSNPDLQQQVRGAELNWKSGQAQLDNRRTDLKQVILNQTAAVKNAEQDFNLAQATLDANEELAKQNLISQVQLKQFRSQLEQARTRLDLAKSQSADNPVYYIQYAHARICSLMCHPAVYTGVSAVIGSWKIIAIWRPRTLRMSLSGRDSRSRPSKIACPPTTRPGGDATRRMIDIAVTLLPQPDSPTMPNVWPG